jgi:hypothetical protein
MKTKVLKMKNEMISWATKFLLFCVLIFSTNQTFAEWRNGMLRIREVKGKAISVSINGRRYPKVSRNLTIADLPAGVHRIKIFKYNSNGHGYGNGVMIYAGDIKIKPRSIYYITALRNNIDIEENCCIDNYGHWNNNDNWDDWDEDNQCWNNNHNWSNIHHDNPKDGQWNNQNGNDWNTHNDNDDWNKDNHDSWTRTDDYDYNDPNWSDYKGAMSSGRFEQLIQQVRKTSFETTKVNVADQALKADKISVNQMKNLLNEFAFESTKLKFAKDNYKRVTDKNNYFMLNDVFTFESSKDELTNFLSTQR